MKLKLLLASIFVLISFVAYQKYSEYSTLKSIDSYDSCATAKGNIIQESYPATCVTRLKSHFVQAIPSPETVSPSSNTSKVSTQSTNKENAPTGIIVKNMENGWDKYINKFHKFEFEYPSGYSVTDYLFEKNGKLGFIILSDEDGGLSLPLLWITKCKGYDNLSPITNCSGGYNDDLADIFFKADVWNLDIGNSITKTVHDDLPSVYLRKPNHIIDGHIFRKFIVTDQAYNTTVVILIELEDNTLTMIGTYSGVSNPDNYDEIISTFHYLD